jgi:hypothetical protein
MTDDLVKQVRDNFIDPRTVPWGFKSPNVLLYKLADRIEALTEQLEDAYARGFCAGQLALKDAGELVTIDSPEIRDHIEALTAELDRARDKYEAKDGMDGAVVYAIRRLLNEANVPLAAFIDDHVRNAIIQRNVAEADSARLREAIKEQIHIRQNCHLMPCAAPGNDSCECERMYRAALTGKETK